MTTRQRLAFLVGLGGLLTVAIILLYTLVRDSEWNAGEVGAHVPSAPVSGQPAVDNRTPQVRPALPKQVHSGEAIQRPKEYTAGDVRVRDHRPGDPAPIDLPPNVHPPGARQLPSTLTADIGQQVRKAVRQCARDIPAAARGETPKFETQLTVAIDDHKLSIVDIASQVRDVAGPAADAMRDCVARNATGLTVSAADQDDIASYGLRLAFVIPHVPPE